LILYEIPLFLLGIVSFLLSTLSMYFWIKLFYHLVGYRYDVNIGKLNNNNNNKGKVFDFSLDEQIRSMKVLLYDKPYTFVKRANFMKRARQKLNWFNTNYTYFVNQRWCFDHANVKQLYASMDKSSQQKYDFDVAKIDFNKYACDAALVCFDKYIKYREEKKKIQGSVEENLKEKLNLLMRQKEIGQNKASTSPMEPKRSLSRDEKMQILDILRKQFFMLGLDRKVSFCIFFGMTMIAAFSFFVWEHSYFSFFIFVVYDLILTRYWLIIIYRRRVYLMFLFCCWSFFLPMTAPLINYYPF